ncbi:MAG: cation acetate symporter, partial [Candidatus Delongbacteria bacterium]|nr:cation acetate symporter [Candidatus Delongbacteria bacterium]
GVSAAFSTVSGLLVAGSSAFSHDLYFRVLNPDATPKKQMFMARMATILMTIIVMAIAMLKLALIAQLVALAFSLAAVTIFPLFLLGIWWSGSNKKGAIAGLSVGLSVAFVSLFYFLSAKYGWDMPGQEFMTYWLGAWYFAWIGAPLAILTNIVVSLMTEETPYEIRKFLVEKVHT